MSSEDLDLARCVVRKVMVDREPYTRETVASCYYALLKEAGDEEAAEVSEKWIDFIWKRIEGLDVSRVANIADSNEKLAKVLYEALGK